MEALKKAKTSTTEPEYIQEGSIKIIKTPETFYNPSQELNRSLSIIVLKYYIKSIHPFLKQPRNPEVRKKQKFELYEAMSASGIRSIRYAKEIDFFSNTQDKYSITINDMSEKACKAIEDNIASNFEDPNKLSRLVVKNKDAVMDLLSEKSYNKYNIIDLDPYGSPSEFIYPSLRAIKNGGLLCVTATDCIALCAKQPELVYKRYNCLPHYGTTSPENAVRIVLADISRIAARMGKSVEPILTGNFGFYIKLFLIVRNKKGEALNNVNNLGVLYECRKCGNVKRQCMGKETSEKKFEFGKYNDFLKTCDYCNESLVKSWPVWINPIKSDLFAKWFSEEKGNLINAHKESFKRPKIEEIASFIESTVSEVDIPLYYNVDTIQKNIRLPIPPLSRMISCIRRLGYSCTRTHCAMSGLKTNADISVIYKIIGRWIEGLDDSKKQGYDKKVLRSFMKGLNLETSDKFDFTYDKEVSEECKKFTFFKNYKNCPKKSV